MFQKFRTSICVIFYFVPFSVFDFGKHYPQDELEFLRLNYYGKLYLLNFKFRFSFVFNKPATIHLLFGSFLTFYSLTTINDVLIG
jgi:hypothetical protein